MTRENLSASIYKHHPESLIALERALEADGVDFREEELVSLLRQLGYEFTVSKRRSFFRFLTDYHKSLWVYLIVAISFVESILVSYNVDSLGLSFLRAVFGILVLGFAPGYSLSRILLPKKDLPLLENVMMSIFLSVIVSIAVGTLLGAFLLFEPGLNIVLLGTATILLALFGAYRSFTLRDVFRQVDGPDKNC